MAVNLSVAQLEYLRQQLYIAKEQLVNGQQAALSTTLTGVQTNVNALVTLVNAGTNASITLTAGLSRDTTG